MTKWRAVAFKDGEQVERHAIPIDDRIPHPESRKCWCSPTDDNGVWVHHSADGRESDLAIARKIAADLLEAATRTIAENMHLADGEKLHAISFEEGRCSGYRARPRAGTEAMTRDCIVCNGTGKVAKTPDGTMPCSFAEAYQIMEVWDCEQCGGTGAADEQSTAGETR